MNPPPAGYTVRPATRDDIDAMAALVQAVDRHDGGVVEPVRGYIEDEWANPPFDPELDTLLAFERNGELAVCATAWGIRPVEVVEAWINVHPGHRGRGLGSWFVAWAEARARRSLEGSGTSTLLRPVVSTPGGGAFLEGLGYRHVRTFWHLERRLNGTEDAGDAPEGVSIRPYREGDGPVAHRILETSFEGHFGFEPMAYDAWQAAHLRAPSTDLSLVFLAERDGEPVAVLTAGSLEDESWVHEVGVLPEHRGAGIGRALLRRVFSELAVRGWTIVKLNVDGENRTGATRLYESVGMRPGRSWQFYEKRIGAD